MENILTIRTTETTQYYVNWDKLLPDEKEILSVLISRHSNVTTQFDKPSSGYQVLSMNNVATLDMTTGLSATDRQYSATIEVDGKKHTIVVLGSQAQTFADLLSQLNSGILAQYARVEMHDKNIYLISNSVGKNSSIKLIGGDLFKSITVFKYPFLPVNGSNDLFDVLNTTHAPNGALYSQMIRIYEKPVNPVSLIVGERVIQPVEELQTPSSAEPTTVAISTEDVSQLTATEPVVVEVLNNVPVEEILTPSSESSIVIPVEEPKLSKTKAFNLTDEEITELVFEDIVNSTITEIIVAEQKTKKAK